MNSRIIFIIALLVMVAGAYGLKDRLSQPSIAQTEQAKPNVDTTTYVQLWRTKTALPRGAVLQPAQLTRLQLPLKEALALGFKQDVTLDFSPTARLNTEVAANTLLQAEEQSRPGDPGYLELLVAKGMTLYPLQVSTRNLIESYIHSGDEIDIMTISSPDHNLAGVQQPLKRFAGVTARLFLQKVRVIDIASTTPKLNSDGESVQATTESEKTGMTTVIIQVKPEQLTRLALAQQTMHMEIYRSYDYAQSMEVGVNDVIANYRGIVELRGAAHSRSESY